MNKNIRVSQAFRTCYNSEHTYKYCLTSSYKYFYDNEIKQLVYDIYKQDIEFYNYSFKF